MPLILIAKIHSLPENRLVDREPPRKDVYSRADTCVSRSTGRLLPRARSERRSIYILCIHNTKLRECGHRIGDERRDSCLRK
jgi:hypothetical protein